jgi:hypothetical protein
MKSPRSEPPDPNEDDRSMELSLEDTLAQRMRGLPVKTRLPVNGYNPYDATPPGGAKDKDKARKKPTDLRKLSEWIRLTRQINELKKEES